MTEAAIRAMAADLGLALPPFTAAEQPALFKAWADRVMQAGVPQERGRLTSADLDECDRQLGIVASRARAPHGSTITVPATYLVPSDGDDTLARIAAAVGLGEVG